MASAASAAQPVASRDSTETETLGNHGSRASLRPLFFDSVVEVGPVHGVAGRGPVPGGVEAAAMQDAAELECQDVGNVVLMEHINLEVPDLEVARLFFAEGLGLTADPGTTAAQRGGLHVMWFNCGKQQFHIARGPRAQVMPPGSMVGLVMPDVTAVAERLEAVQQLLGDVSLTYTRGGRLEVVDPYGNSFTVHASLPYFPARQGIAYLQLPCFRGTAARIAAFYAARIGAKCRVSAAAGAGTPATAGTDSTTARGGSGASSSPVRAEVMVGPGQKLVFVEQSALGPLSEQAVVSLFSGWHVAMYVADFSRTFTAVHHPDKPPFNDHPYRDKYDNLQDALRNRQFRFQDIVAPEGDEEEKGAHGQGQGRARGKALLYRISHEVRSLHHPLYGRPLYGRETGFA